MGSRRQGRVYDTRACEHFTFCRCGDCGWSCREDEHLICKENEHLILLMEEILPVSKRCRCKYVKHVIPALPPSLLDMQCCLVDEECLCAHEILQVNIALRGEGGEQNATMSFQFCTQLIPCSVNLQYFLRPLN